MRTRLLIFGVLLLSGVAFAEEDAPAAPAPDPVVAADLKRAEELVVRVEALYEQGKYREALTPAREALAIREKRLGPDHVSVAKCLNALGMVLRQLGAYKDVVPLYERALKINERHLGTSHQEVAVVLNNLARVHRIRGDLERARPIYERALAILEKTLGPKHRYVAGVLNNLAALLGAAGAYEEARPLYERSIRIAEMSRGKDHPQVAKSLVNLARLLKVQGAREEARAMLLRGLEIYEAALGPDHPLVSQALVSLGALLYAEQKFPEAQPHIERALRILEEVYGKDHLAVVKALNNLAAVVEERGEVKRARSLFARVLSIREAAFGESHPDLAKTHQNIGRLLHASGELVASARHLRRSLQIVEESLGPSHPSVADVLGSLAVVLLAQGQRADALVAIDRAMDVTEQNARNHLIGLQPSARVAYAQAARVHLAVWVRQFARFAKGSGYDRVLRFKGLVARITAAERQAVRAAGAKMHARLGSVRAAERRTSRLANSAPPFRQKARRAAWQKAYASARQEEQAMRLALQRDIAPLRSGLERLDLTRAMIQKHIPTNAVLLDYLQVGGSYFVWVVRGSGAPVRVDLGNAAAIEAAVDAFVDAVASRSGAAWSSARAALSALVLTPLRANLPSGLRHIVVCPDAVLARVPFGVLAHAGGRSLLEEIQVTSVPFAQDLVPPSRRVAAGSGALVLGGVDYDTAESGGEGEAQLAENGLRMGSTERFPPLVGTLHEAKAIGSLMPSRVILGRAATERQLRALVRGRRVLHLATHGFARVDLWRGLKRSAESEVLQSALLRQLAQGHDPMMLSGLALAGVNERRGGGGDDGVLTALEASHLGLDGVRLTVLSACETALGRAASGEGVHGLVRGFHMAGSRTVIGSLWKVDDEATRALMVRFYELWNPRNGKGKGAAEALRQAQAHVRSQDKWKHPYFWAAWVLSGATD